MDKVTIIHSEKSSSEAVLNKLEKFLACAKEERFESILIVGVRPDGREKAAFTAVDLKLLGAVRAVSHCMEADWAETYSVWNGEPDE